MQTAARHQKYLIIICVSQYIISHTEPLEDITGSLQRDGNGNRYDNAPKNDLGFVSDK